EGRPPLEIPSQPLPSLISSADADSGDADALCRATDHLTIMDSSLETNNNKVHGWESLPWPALDRISFHLRTNEDCSDLTNISIVSTHFRTGVTKFMNRLENRPTIENISILKDDNGLVARVYLFPSNLPFHGLTTLDSRRFHRSGNSDQPRIEVEVNGPEDPILEQVSGILSTSIKKVEITAWNFSSTDFSLCTQLLHTSKTGLL
ncbi:hypothetical protein PMAYCL1PPCAC_08339, partial [Pristionchus mayeri]